MSSSMDTGADLRLAAVLTAYHPDERLAAVVDAALLTCTTVIVVDNTPADEVSAADKLADPRVRVVRSAGNVGVGGGLNTGLRELPQDAEAVLFLDQDSVLSEELVRGLVAHLEDQKVAIAAPEPWDEANASHYATFAGMRSTVSDRDAVITSGMVVRKSAIEEVGGFREDFFMDYVDMDFCLRIRRTGARIVQDQSLRLPHSIGDRREHSLLFAKVPVIHYPAWRHYWIARNGLILIRENLRREPVWTVKTALYLIRWITVTVLFEPARISCAGAFLRGLRDGVSRRVSAAYLPADAQLPAVQAVPR